MSLDLITDLRNQVESKQAIIVVGAGVSMGATNCNILASWKGLLHNGARFCKMLPVAKVDAAWEGRIHDQIESNDMVELLTAAHNISEHLGAPKGGEYRRWLRETIGSLSIQRHDTLNALRDLELPIATTNYDGLLEEATGMQPVTWMDVTQVQELLRGQRNGILHLHGYWDRPETVVLGPKKYDEILGHDQAQTLQKAMSFLKTIVFVGFGSGLSDPNFAQLLDWMRASLSDSTFRHFRLCTDDEVQLVQAQHPAGQRIHALTYGRTYNDLASFLRKLLPPKLSRPALGRHSPDIPTVPPSPACFGRDVEINRLVATLLSDIPAPIPIIGAPGIGKTTVALVALNEGTVMRKFGDRRFFIRCDAAQDRQALAAEIARTIGVDISPNVELSIMHTLSHAPAALVLDNLESPWANDQTNVEELLGYLAKVRDCALVVTLRGASRPLNVPWQDSIHLSVLSEAHSRQAFHFITSNEFAFDRDLSELLLALDNIPLAVTLMAHSAQGEPNLHGVLERWRSERTGMLRRGGANTAELSIEVCYETVIGDNRMDDEARRLLSILAIVPDGIHQHHIQKVCRTCGWRAANRLTSVGLAFYEKERLRLLAPLREYVRKQYKPDPDLLRFLLEFYYSLSSHGEKAGRVGGAEAISALSPEAANIESAILFGLDLEDPMPAISAALGMARFTRFSGAGSTFFLEKAAACANRTGNLDAGARCHKRLADIEIQRSDEKRAENYYKEALTHFSETGNELRQATCIAGLGFVALHRSDYVDARSKFEGARNLYESLGKRRGAADCIKYLGDIELAQERLDSARGFYDSAKEIYKSIGDILGLSNAVKGLGDVHRRRDHYIEAVQWYNVAIRYYSDIGDVLGEANCLQCIGHIDKEKGAIDGAIRNYHKALGYFRRVRDPHSIAGCLECLANVQKKNEDRVKFAKLAIEVWRSVAQADHVHRVSAVFGIDL